MSQTPAFDLAPTPVARRLLELYQRDLGLAESPLGSNRGPQIEKYLRGYRNRYGDRYARGAKWCALACEYLARESYDTLGITPCPLDAWHGLGGASGWLRFAERDGALLVTMDPAPGDVAVIYDAVKDVMRMPDNARQMARKMADV